MRFTMLIMTIGSRTHDTVVYKPKQVGLPGVRKSRGPLYIAYNSQDIGKLFRDSLNTTNDMQAHDPR